MGFSYLDVGKVLCPPVPRFLRTLRFKLFWSLLALSQSHFWSPSITMPELWSIHHHIDPDAPFFEGRKPVICARPCAHGRRYTRLGELDGFTSWRCKEQTALNYLSHLLISKHSLGHLKGSLFPLRASSHLPLILSSSCWYTRCLPTPNYFRKFQILLTIAQQDFPLTPSELSSRPTFSFHKPVKSIVE